MSEAILTLQRHYALWAAELRIFVRKLEKAAPDSDPERVAVQGIEVCRGNIAAFAEVLNRLGADVPVLEPEPTPEPVDG